MSFRRIKSLCGWFNSPLCTLWNHQEAVFPCGDFPGSTGQGETETLLPVEIKFAFVYPFPYIIWNYLDLLWRQHGRYIWFFRQPELRGDCSVDFGGYDYAFWPDCDFLAGASRWRYVSGDRSIARSPEVDVIFCPTGSGFFVAKKLIGTYSVFPLGRGEAFPQIIGRRSVNCLRECFAQAKHSRR